MNLKGCPPEFKGTEEERIVVTFLMDTTKAFNTMILFFLTIAMLKAGLPITLVVASWALISRRQGAAEVGGKVSEWIKVATGGSQGGFPTAAFYLYSNKLCQKIVDRLRL